VPDTPAVKKHTINSAYLELHGAAFAGHQRVCPTTT
jgi:hypothetical protein